MDTSERPGPPPVVPARAGVAVAVVTVLPALTLAAGWLGDLAPVPGLTVHTLVETLGAVTALITAAMALVDYRVRRDAMTLAIGTALASAGIVDLFHLLASAGLVSARTANEAFIPFTWAISRVFYAAALTAGAVLGLVWGRRDTRPRWLVAGMFPAAAFAVIGACIVAPVLPVTMFPDALIRRPWDVVPMGILAAAAFGVAPLLRARHPGPFADAVFLSLIPAIGAQAHMVFGSGTLFDGHFTAAHGLKVLSYAIPLVGLLLQHVEDQARRARVAEDLQETEARFRSAFDDAAIGMAMVSPAGRWLRVNYSLCQMLGYTAEELLATDFQHITHPDDLDKDISLVQQVLCGDIATYQMEKRYVRKRGTVVWVNLSVSLVRGPDGTPRYFISQIEDISGRKAAERDRDSHRRELERSNEELSRFAYVASHDLQEPLRSISGFTQLLARRYQGRLDEDADDFITFIVGGTERMQRIIRDLLAYSRVRTRGVVPVPTQAAAAAREAVANLDAAITEAGASVHVADLPEVTADYAQLVQLFQNLVGNAIKFRRAAPPEVRVSGSRNGTSCHFRVADNGVGIDPAHADRIFQLFQRLHTREDYPGTGLGLAICRQIVERHGGEIWIDSVPGEGSTFHFTIPILEPARDTA